LGGYLDIWLVGKMLVKRVPIWCRIKFHCFYNFADEYYGESGVSATSYKEEGHDGTRNTKKGYNNHKTESRSNGGREWNSIFSYRRRYEIILTRSKEVEEIQKVRRGNNNHRY
jgi:hypothetical protein